MEASLAFYRAIGLALNEEKHGSGPVHYSCQLGETVLEIYPGKTQELLDYRGGGANMPGFKVISLDAVLAVLEQMGVQTLSQPKSTVWGKRVVVQDPYGRTIELRTYPNRLDRLKVMRAQAKCNIAR